MFSFLFDYNFWDGAKASKGIIRQKYLNKLISFDKTKSLIGIMGQRRSGKSYIAHQFIDLIRDELRVDHKQVFYGNFFLDAYASLKKPETFYEAIRWWQKELKVDLERRMYIFLDEIQLLENWHSVVLSLFEHPKREYKIIISGSNGKLLSEELSKHLGGRYYELHVYPLTYHEFLSFTDLDSGRDSFFKFIKEGGMPEIVQIDDEYSKGNLSKTMMDSIMVRDIISRHNIKSPLILKKLFEYFAQSYSHMVSNKRIYDTLRSHGEKTGIQTITEYVEYIKEVYFVHECHQFSLRKNAILERTANKFYLNDHRFSTIYQGIKNIDRVLENIIFMELLKHDYEVTTLKDSKKGLEIDFLAQKANEKIYIQVAYSVGDSESQTFNREFGNFSLIQDHFPKYVLSLDEILITNEKGIQHLNPWNFLKDLESE